MARRDTRKYQDRRKYLIAAAQKRRKKLREMAIQYKGGRCQTCGYSRCAEALEFHHKDSKHKKFGISARGYTRSWQKVCQELDKCILVCANCHRELHVQYRSFPEKSGLKQQANSGKSSAKDNPERSPDCAN